MTPESKAAALARCDAEIARIEKDGSTNQYKAWEIALARFDWEMEKRAIENEYSLNEHVLQPLNASDPTLEPMEQSENA